MIQADILLATEPRFSGGSSTALLADAEAFLDAGATIALLPVTSDFFAGAPDEINPHILALADRDGVVLVKDRAQVSCQTAFFHHPLTFAHQIKERVAVSAKSAVLVAHHPPFYGDGALEYNPISITRNIRKSFGPTPLWAPVSGGVRAQLACFAPLICLSAEDWTNVFDTNNWIATDKAFSRQTSCVGRHSRPDFLKWPDFAKDAQKALTPGPDWHTRIMGLAPELATDLSPAATGWDVLEFNAEPVTDFLNSLDAFSYFYHSRWVEAFGRTIVEAMLMERPCVLDQRLKPNFGPLATYCSISEATGCLNHLRDNPRETQKRATDVRAQVVASYSKDCVMERLAALGPTSDTQNPTFGRLTTLRKTIGLARRKRLTR